MIQVFILQVFQLLCALCVSRFEPTTLSYIVYYYYYRLMSKGVIDTNFTSMKRVCQSDRCALSLTGAHRVCRIFILSDRAQSQHSPGLQPVEAIRDDVSVGQVLLVSARYPFCQTELHYVTHQLVPYVTATSRCRTRQHLCLPGTYRVCQISTLSDKAPLRHSPGLQPVDAVRDDIFVLRPPLRGAERGTAS